MTIIHILSFLFTFLCAVCTWSQTFIEVARYPIQKNTAWTVDGLENIITTHSTTIKKYDKNGALLFEQGNKQIGSCKNIGQINFLKFYVFSEEQQLICFYDNSLSPLEKCIDLSDLEFINVQLIEYSQQTGVFWIFDQFNSTLSQLPLDGTKRFHTIKNIKGTLSVNYPTQLIEFGNKLFMLDEYKKIYVFDRFGSFLERIDIPTTQWIQVNSLYLICLVGSQLKFINLNNQKTIDIDIQYNNVETFIIRGDFIYFHTENELIKTQLSLNPFENKR